MDSEPNSNASCPLLDVLWVDEVGYLPVGKTGADLLFQAINQRYEHGSIVLTTDQAYKHRAKLFNNDSTLNSAVLDRRLHHAETVIIEGESYRMKDRSEAPSSLPALHLRQVNTRSPFLFLRPNQLNIFKPA